MGGTSPLQQGHTASATKPPVLKHDGRHWGAETHCASLPLHRARQRWHPVDSAAVWWCSGQLLFPASESQLLQQLRENPHSQSACAKLGIRTPSQGKNTHHGPWANSGTFMGMQEPPGEAQRGSGTEGMVKFSPGEGSAAREPDPSSSPTGTWQANARSQPAFSYQLMKSTLGQTSASHALQVFQISD